VRAVRVQKAVCIDRPIKLPESFPSTRKQHQPCAWFCDTLKRISYCSISEAVTLVISSSNSVKGIELCMPVISRVHHRVNNKSTHTINSTNSFMSAVRCK
jgi:predicted transcriptional regulator